MRAVNEKIVVEVLEWKEKMSNGVMLPSTRKVSFIRGRVLSVDASVSNIKVGEVVCFGHGVATLLDEVGCVAVLSANAVLCVDDNYVEPAPTPLIIPAVMS